MFNTIDGIPQTVIGVLTPHTGGFYYGSVMNGILSAACQNHAVAVAFETSRLRLLNGREVLSSAWVDGWLAVNEFDDPALLAELRARGEPVVHVNSKSDVENGAVVLPDNAAGARFVTEHLIGHGHRRIAFAGNLSHVDIAERLSGYRAALTAAGLEASDDLVFDTPHHKELDGRNVAHALLELRHAPTPRIVEPATALVAGTDRLALGVMSALLEAGLELPREFALVGFDDADAAQFAEPPLTTVQQSFSEVAARAAVELLDAIRERRQPVALTRIPTQPMLRRSCGCMVSNSMPPSMSSPVKARVDKLTRALLLCAGRNRMGGISLAEWPEAEKIARAMESAADGTATQEPVKGDWWSGFLVYNRDAENTVRVMELLESTLQAWSPSSGKRSVGGILRDLRVTLMHEWQRTERVMVAHYESVTETAYRLASALSNPIAAPSHDLSWIRWSNPERACCALWTEVAVSLMPKTHEEPTGVSERPKAFNLRVTGEYSSALGNILKSPGLPAISPVDFPPLELLQAAYEEGAIVTVATVPRGRGGDYGLLAVVAPLAFEQLEYVGTPGDWAVQLGTALDRAAAERELRASAELDALTGLANRTTLLERVEALRTSKDALGFALLFIDLDDFKKVNDSLGHLVGDQLLVQIAERLTLEARAHAARRADRIGQNVVARLGGDEFVVVLAGIEDENEAVLVVERLLGQLKQAYVLEGSSVFVSASIGIIFSQGPDASALDLLRDADTAMYRAKMKGRARHEIFHHGMHKQALERLHLDARLRLALEQDELELYYQPIVELATGSDVGAEALIRWRHPEQGLLSPARFLAVAEDVGLAIPFSEWVIRRACTQAVRWQLAGGRSPYVNVNVPAVHIKQQGFVEFVEGALLETGLSPRAFGIEIVESTLLDEPTKCALALTRLMALGVRVSIDDFGTGYSSLSYLRDFRVSKLKIDRSFVTNIPGNARDNGITRAIIAMGQGLGLGVVAEGIETPEQLQFLKHAGCDYAQGYFISVPLEVEAYVARLAQLRAVEAPTSSRRSSTRSRSWPAF